jgi:hypothetical protein
MMDDGWWTMKTIDEDGRTSRDHRRSVRENLDRVKAGRAMKIQWLLVFVAFHFAVFVDSFSVQKNPATTNGGPPERLASKEKLRWITCSSTNELEAAVSQFVRPGDAVAELGSQLRDVSTTICETLDGKGSAVLVDVARKFPKNTNAANEGPRTRAMRRPDDEIGFYPGVATFMEIPELDGWRSAFQESKTDSFDVLVLDVNAIVGNDLEWTSLSIVREFTAMYANCRVVLIKSLNLNQWATRLVHGQRWIDNQSVYDKSRGPHIIATVGVQEYRKTIPFTVKAGDSVLEVGCHLGTSSVLLQEAASAQGDAGYCIGVDVGPKIIQGAMERYPSVYFSVGDAWKTAALLRVQQEFHASHEQKSNRLGFDVIYVDVGGLSGSDGLLESLSLLSSLMNALEPQYIVIKSLCMRRLASTLIPYWRAK